MGIIGLDVGGANLKVAHSGGAARTVPFALWKEPERLATSLQELLDDMHPADDLALTMTGELCDCFASKREGVEFILEATRRAARERRVHVWTLQGRFMSVDEARTYPLDVAAANWLALANYAARCFTVETGLLLDIGSTTTDIIPLRDGKACPQGLSDAERLRSGELVYVGARRTPLCALVDEGVAAEWFATTLDAFLVLELLPEVGEDRNTADGRPATRSCAHGRLAHMLGADGETCSATDTQSLAYLALGRLVERVWHGVKSVAGGRPGTVILSGSGEFVGRLAVGRSAEVVSLADEWGPALSEAACAYAVARLAATR
jgi:probable H4MPT-linked C1 transfer pathway protein